MNSLKKYEGVPLLNFEGHPGVSLLNFEWGPGVPLLNFRWIRSPTFKLWEGSQVPSLEVPGPGSWSHFHTMLQAISFSMFQTKKLRKSFDTVGEVHHHELGAINLYLGNIFLEEPYTKCGEKTIPRLFYKK